MPLFISHISYLSKFWKAACYPDQYLRDGIFGTSFPDIRYLIGQSRVVTHLEGLYKEKTYGPLFLQLSEVLNEKLASPDGESQRFKYFKAGFVFHIILDKWWSSKISFKSDFKLFGMCLKFLDEQLRWNTFGQNISYIGTLDMKVSFADIPEQTVGQWYSFLSGYLRIPPTPESAKSVLVKKLKMDPVLARQAKEEIKKIRNNPEIVTKLNEMFESFEWDKISGESILS